MVGDIIDRIKRGRNLCVMDADLKVYHLGRIQPLIDKVNQLVTSGHQIELLKGVFPVDAEETEDTRAILWRHMAEEGQPPEQWQLLVYEHELKGDPGEKGDPGQDGKSIALKGHVTWNNDLTKIDAKLGEYYLVTKSGHLWTPWQLPTDHIANWTDCGLIQGPRGPKGDKGPKGSSGGVSAFILSWLASTVTNTAITVATQIANDEIMEGLNMMEDAIQSAAQTAVDEALEEMADELKGDKGEKGDDGEKGEDGKDGKTFNVKGSFETGYPPYIPTSSRVGDGYIRNEDGHLFVCLEITGIPGTYEWKDVGLIRGPDGKPGKDAKWGVQLLDKLGANIGTPIEVKNSEDNVANFHIKGSENIKVEQLVGVQKGFMIKYEPKKEEEVIPTEIKIKNATTQKVYSITVSTSGRLEVEEVING